MATRRSPKIGYKDRGGRTSALRRRMERSSTATPRLREYGESRRDIRQAERLFNELRGAYEAAAAAIAAPSLDDYVNTQVYDVAEGQARKSYNQALPTIKNISRQLMANLRGNIKDSKGDTKRAARASRRAERANLEDVAQLEAQALGDLQAQFGDDLAGSVTSDQELLGAVYSQQARENALAEKQHLRDVARAERESYRDRMATGEAVNAAALSQAQTNLNEVLNQIGLGRAEAEGQGRKEFAAARQAYSADQADRMLQLAGMQHEHDMSQLAARQALRSGEQQYLDEARQAAAGLVDAEAGEFAKLVTKRAEKKAGEDAEPEDYFVAVQDEYQRVLEMMRPMWEEEGLDVGEISKRAFRRLQLLQPSFARPEDESVRVTR